MHLSVVIITYNEEKNIGRCIDSVASVADEIVVLDSNSTDNTCMIARSKGAIIYQQPFLGHIEQKNRALSFACNDYVLSLDADEALDITLRDSISQVKKKGFTGIYTMNRCMNYCGKFIRHGSWYPEKKLRLFNRQKACWGGINPHDKIILKESQSIQHLEGDILHYSFYTMDEHIAQNNKFSTLSAAAMFARQKKTNFFKLLIHPPWAFFMSYFLRLGFLDGFYGYFIAINIAHLTFLKHSKLLQLQRKAKK